MKTLLALILLTGSAQAVTFDDVVGTHSPCGAWSANCRNPADVRFSFDSTKSYAQQQADFAKQVPNLSKYARVVLQAWGSRDAEIVVPALNTMRDDPEGFKAHMAAMATLVKGMPNVYIQVGNEINNGPNLSPAIHAWLGDGLPGKTNDLSVVPTLAWAHSLIIDGLRQGDPNAQVILGSVANAASATAFIDAYLAEMAAKASIGSIHYSMGADNWQTPIDQYTSRGLKVWSTEEGGGQSAEKGICMVASIKALARRLSLPDPGMVFVWGASVGYADCDANMHVVKDAMPGGVAPSAEPVISGNGLSTYSYNTGIKRVGFAFGNGTLTGVTGAGTVYVFRAGGVVEQYAAASSMSIKLDFNSAVFVAIE